MQNTTIDNRHDYLGIIGAMEEEVEKLKGIIEIEDTIKHRTGLTFYKGTIQKIKVVVVVCGIGKVNAAMCTQILIDKFNVKGIINTGVAGALSSSLNIGDMVVSTDAICHDMDATGFGYELGQIPRMDIKYFPADEQLIAAIKEAEKNINIGHEIFYNRIVSGDQFVSDSKKKDVLVENFNGFCAEMEGAAIAQVSYLNNVPFVIIRAISDKADDSANMDYSEFIKEAIDNTIKLVVETLQHI